MAGQYTVDKDPGGILRDIRCFALDMDGTIYLGEQWLPGAREFLKALETSGRSYVFMTNNSSKSADAYLEKLNRMGHSIEPSQLISSAHATMDYLWQHHSGQAVYLLGNPILREEFRRAGILLEDHHPDVVVTAFDTTLDYAKLCAVCDFVRAGLPYIGTHPDFNCPTETGFIPDIGAIHAFIEASTGRKPDKIIGKPHREIIDYMLGRTGSSPDRTAVVGDRLYTDVASGVQNGLTGILVLSGEAGLADLPDSPVQPHLIFSSVREMIPFL